MQRTFNHVASTLGWIGALGLSMALSACSKDETTGGGSFDKNCNACRTFGDTCDNSNNCPPRGICNDPADPLYVSDAMTGICIKVTCDGDADCDSPKKCNLSKICEAPVCVADSQCSGGSVCLAGSCQARPAAGTVASCEVLSTGGAIKQGQTVEVTAVAKNANGKALGGVAFTWTSDNDGAASVDGGVVTGGSSSGTANVTAKVDGGANCTGMATFRNFAAVAAGEARVILVDRRGAPVSGATVYLATQTSSSTAMTGADGAASFMGVNGAIASVTAIKQGWQYVSVVQPGTNDIFLETGAKPDATRAGGFRGNVDISKAARGEIKLGIAGPSFPSNVLDLELTSIIGDFVETRINAPDLGLNDQVVPLPGGVMLGLGSEIFTDDTQGNDLRCQGDGPGANEIGCYSARGPVGPTAAWVLAGQLRLSVLAPLAGQISGAIGGDGGLDSLPIGELLASVLPLLRELRHGINAGVNITEFPKVNAPGQTGNCSDPNLADYDDKCIGDFSKYSPIELAADQELRILSAVQVPQLPRLPGGDFAGAAIVLGGALVPGRGLLPLGLSAGLDTEDDTDTPDGRVFGVDEPFGKNSDPLEDGYVPLSMAPPHSGIEGSQVLLVGVALDIESITDSGVQISVLVNRVNQIGERATLTGTFPAFPQGSLDVGRGVFTPGNSVSGAGVTRLRMERNGQEWLVYAPHGMTAFTLPNVATAKNDVLGAGMDALLQVVSSEASFTDLFTFGSGRTVDRLGETTNAFVVQQCSTDAGSACQIQ
jgi:hypothetical protein